MKKTILLLSISIMLSSLVNANIIKENENKQLKGNVSENIDGKNTPLEFALVSIEGTCLSTFTDENGNFTLNIDNKKKYTLKISHVGYNINEEVIKTKGILEKSYILEKQEILFSKK